MVQIRLFIYFSFFLQNMLILKNKEKLQRSIKLKNIYLFIFYIFFFTVLWNYKSFKYKIIRCKLIYNKNLVTLKVQYYNITSCNTHLAFKKERMRKSITEHDLFAKRLQ